MPVLVLTPVIPEEGYSLLLGLDGLTSLLGFREKGVEIGLVVVLVAMQA
jgi:hypothetical protein